MKISALLLALSLSVLSVSAADEFAGKADTPPKLLKSEKPIYPFDMLKACIIGRVTVAFVIDERGDVAEAFVAKSNNPWFERPALDAIFQWKFTPAMKDGRAVKTRARQEINFNLNNIKETDLWRINKGKDFDKLPPALQWDVPPQPENTTLAVYPFEALVAGRRGQARIQVVIDEKGRVAGAKVIEAKVPEFGAAMLAMIDGWRFKPARKADGSPCGALVAMELEFSASGREVPVTAGARRVLGRLDSKHPKFAEAGELDEPLKPISQRPPVYPTALRKEGVAGQTVVEFYVDEEGDAQLPRVVSASAPEFGYAAVQAVATWRFNPPKQAGKKAIARVRVPVDFSFKP